MIIYQLYIRSVGTFREIEDNIMYYRHLGVDAIWFNPFYPHGGKDGGYDILNFTDVAEEFGTIDDFKSLLQKAHNVGLKIIIDMVLNHVSEQHIWFQDSIRKLNGRDDWFVWKNKSEITEDWK